MKVCRIRPDKNHCENCVDMQIAAKQINDCNTCPFNIKEYELLSVVPGIFREYAIVVMDGVARRVELSKIYDIKEV